MKLFSRLFSSRRETNPTTTFERQRLGRTMPAGKAQLGRLAHERAQIMAAARHVC